MRWQVFGYIQITTYIYVCILTLLFACACKLYGLCHSYAKLATQNSG